MLRSLRIELEKILYSRVFYACLAVFLVYAIFLMLGFRHMMRGLGLTGGGQSGALFLYTSLQLAFYPFVVAVAIILAAGAVSMEIRGGTLRYGLIAPIARWEYLVAKFVVTAAATAAAVLFLFLILGGIGTLLLGRGNVLTYDVWAPGKPETRLPTLLSEEETVRRCLLALPFLLLSAIANASPAFLLSTLVGSPVLAITVPLSVFFIFSIVQFSPFLPTVKDYLPTRHMFYWDAVFSPDIAWDVIWHGVLFHGTILIICLGVALVLFMARDVTS